MKLTFFTFVLCASSSIFAMQPPVQQRTSMQKTPEEVLKKDFLEKAEGYMEKCPFVCSPLIFGGVLLRSFDRIWQFRAECGKYATPEYMYDNCNYMVTIRGQSGCQRYTTKPVDDDFLKCHTPFTGFNNPEFNSKTWSTRTVEMLTTIETGVLITTIIGTAACGYCNDKLRNRNAARRTERQKAYAKYLRDEYSEDNKKTN